MNMDALHAEFWPSDKPVTAVLLLVGLAAAVVGKRRYFSSISDIPGPVVASFSIWWQIYHLFKGHNEEEIVRMHRQYGDFIRIAHDEVSVGHPDAVKQILKANISKTSWYLVFSFPDHRYVNQMSELDPRRHIQKGKNVTPAYSLSNIIKSEPQVDALMELLETKIDAMSDAGKPVEFDKWFNYCAFDTLGEVTFSEPFKFVEKGYDIRNAIANTRALALYIAVMGHFIWLHDLTLGNPLLSRLGLQPSSHIFDTCLAAMDARRGNTEVHKDMMGQWLEARRQSPDRMAENDIFSAAVVTLAAGADTVSASLQAFFYYLLRHPGHFQRLRDEIDSAHSLGQLSPIVSYAEAQNLPYLQACIKETYRIHPAVPSRLPRVVPAEGMTIAGRYFEPGTTLSVSPLVFHKNREIFGADCDIFNPDRWLDKERYNEMNRFLIHWSAGYNQCPGRHLAHFEISKLTATLVRDYDIEQLNPNQDWTFENHFTAVPYNWPCTVKRRDTQGINKV